MRAIHHRATRPGLAALLVPMGLSVALGCQPLPENLPQRWIGRDAGTVDPGSTGRGGAAGAPVDDPGLPGTGGGGAPAGAGGALSGTGGAGGSALGPDAAEAEVPPAIDAPLGSPIPCTLEVTVTTATTNNDYAPRNIGALWIADAGGKFVKTLAVWAGRRVNHLNTWNQLTGAAGLARNKVDAVTGATIGSHMAHKATWNCTDAKQALVPQGMYRLCAEMTEANAQGPQHCVPFTHGGTAFQLMPLDVANFKARRLVYTPR